MWLCILVDRNSKLHSFLVFYTIYVYIYIYIYCSCEIVLTSRKGVHLKRKQTLWKYCVVVTRSQVSMYTPTKAFSNEKCGRDFHLSIMWFVITIVFIMVDLKNLTRRHSRAIISKPIMVQNECCCMWTVQSVSRTNNVFYIASVQKHSSWYFLPR